MYELQVSGNQGFELRTTSLAYAQRKAREWSYTQTITIWYNSEVYSVYKNWRKGRK